MTKPDPVPRDSAASNDVGPVPLPRSGNPHRPSANATAARDRTWINRIGTGDPSAFESLFRAYTPCLCDFVFRYVHSREEAQEIVQDLFVWIWQRREELQIRGTVSSYLYTAARHRAINRLRHERVRERWRRGAVALSDLDSDSSPLAADTALELAEREAAIERAIAALPKRRRAVCVLRWVEGLSYAEIAQRLGISEKTVDGQLQRAIRHIRSSLRQF